MTANWSDLAKSTHTRVTEYLPRVQFLKPCRAIFASNVGNINSPLSDSYYHNDAGLPNCLCMGKRLVLHILSTTLFIINPSQFHIKNFFFIMSSNDIPFKVAMAKSWRL